MRVLVISDIHANLAAFEAVLEDARGQWEFVWCLGDVVGYGPDPNECCELLRSLPHLCLAGNHDWAALGRLTLDDFNTEARIAHLWTREEISPTNQEYLQQLPMRLEQGDFTLVHGSPREPMWEYLLDLGGALVSFSYFSTPFCLVGHTHLPMIFVLDEETGRPHAVIPEVGVPIPLRRYRMILNPGSVGQPRDGDPRASYAILDTDAMTWELRRVPYPIEITQERMRARGLPRRLIARLEVGR